MSEAPEIADHESTVVSSLAGDADGASVATRGNIRHVVDFQDSGTIWLNIGKVFGVFFWLVDHVSVSWVRTSEEIPLIKECLALVLVL